MINELVISGKKEVFDFNAIPNTNWYYGMMVDEETAYQSVRSMVTSSLIQGLISRNLHHCSANTWGMRHSFCSRVTLAQQGAALQSEITCLLTLV